MVNYCHQLVFVEMSEYEGKLELIFKGSLNNNVNDNNSFLIDTV